jgi:hypothetical protein
MRGNEDMPRRTIEALEEQVRDAFRAATSTITAEDLPPRPAPARNSRAAQAARGLWVWAPRVRARALVPVLAAASVTVIAVTAAVVGPRLLNGAPGGATATPATGPLAGAPRFFAGITIHPVEKVPVPTVVKIYRFATGRPLAEAVTVPASQKIQSVSRLGNDRTFVVAAVDDKACVTHFLKFSINAAGQLGSATPLSVPSISGAAEELTSSADGKVLAFLLSPCKPGDMQVAAIHLATGQVSRWRSPTVPGSPSLTADGSVLGFVASRTIRAQKNLAWTIRTDAPAGPLFKRARTVLDLATGMDEAVLSPSGTQLYVETLLGSGRGPVVLNLYRTSTGSLIRQITRLGPGGSELAIIKLSLDAAGRHLLAEGFLHGPRVKAFDLRTGRYITLSVPDLAAHGGGLTTLAW